MRKISITVVLIIVMSGCMQPIKHKSALFGVWKSNEEKTLQSMRTVSGITNKARQLLKNDFFGHLIAEYRENDARAYFDRDKDNTEEMKKFYPYQVLEENKEFFVIRVHNELEGGEREVTLHRDSDCYYLPVSKWNFREYFCRVK